MSNSNQLHINQLLAWVETQKLSIRSCELNIRHHREDMELLHKSIEAETKELKAKEALLDSVIADIDKLKTAQN